MTACAWCANPATTTVMLEPARMGLIEHPIHGPQKSVVKRAITTPACAACADKATLTPGVLQRDPRSVAAPDQQTSIYDYLEDRP